MGDVWNSQGLLFQVDIHPQFLSSVLTLSRDRDLALVRECHIIVHAQSNVGSSVDCMSDKVISGATVIFASGVIS